MNFVTHLCNAYCNQLSRDPRPEVITFEFQELPQILVCTVFIDNVVVLSYFQLNLLCCTWKPFVPIIAAAFQQTTTQKNIFKFVYITLFSFWALQQAMSQKTLLKHVFILNTDSYFVLQSSAQAAELMKQVSKSRAVLISRLVYHNKCRWTVITSHCVHYQWWFLLCTLVCISSSRFDKQIWV